MGGKSGKASARARGSASARWVWAAVAVAAAILLPVRGASGAASDHPRLTPGAGEVSLSTGLIEGDYLFSASFRKAVSPCLDLGGTATAIPARGRRSDLFFTMEARYGLWYCCIPDRYVNYLYFAVGAGSFSRMGLAERENGFAVTGGPGLRIDLLGRFIVGAEVKGYAVFRDGGTDRRLAVMLTAGLPL